MRNSFDSSLSPNSLKSHLFLIHPRHNAFPFCTSGISHCIYSYRTAVNPIILYLHKCLFFPFSALWVLKLLQQWLTVKSQIWVSRWLHFRRQSIALNQISHSIKNFNFQMKIVSEKCCCWFCNFTAHIIMKSYCL